MTDKRDVKLARKAREQKFEPVTVAFTGKIVSRNGSVAVPGVFNHVWVLATDTAEPEAVYNRRVKDTRPGLPVVVGYAPKSKILEILQTDVEHLAGFYETGGLDTQRHADTHLDTGDDPVYVNRRMITDQLYVAPGSGLAVNVSPYEYDVDGVRKYFPGQNNYSLAASKPAAGLARYVLVYLDTADNTVKTVDGTTVVDLDWYIPPKPDTPNGGVTAGYVRIDGSQTAIARTDIDQGRRLWLPTRRWFLDTEGDPAAVGPTAADGTSGYAARRDHTHTIDIPGFTEETTAADTDVLLIYDAGAAAHRKMTRANLLAGVGLDINGLTEETSIADNDEFPLYDVTAAANRKATRANILAGIDKVKVSKLRESDDGGDALTADANGNLTATSGHISLAALKDVFPYNDASGLFSRLVNFKRVPDEHWSQGADQLTWLGWATYTGSWGTPATITRSISQLSVTHGSGLRVFYYKDYTDGQAAIFAACGVSLGNETGLMLDDGNDSADGLGAANFVRIFIEYPTASSPANLAAEYRVGGGAVTKTTYLSLPPQNIVGLSLQYGVGTRWTNWTAQIRIFGTAAIVTFIANIATGLAWTPARHGLYGRIGVVNRTCVWDWFEEP
jgi:hypothetical protein